MVENGSEGFKYDGFEDFGGLNGYLFEDVVDSSSVEDPVMINDKNDILEVDLASFCIACLCIYSLEPKWYFYQLRCLIFRWKSTFEAKVILPKD